MTSRFDPEDFQSSLRGKPAPKVVPIREEIIVDTKTGDMPSARQAGTVDPHPHSEYLLNFKKACEADLYIFAKSVMGMTLLTEELHKPTCAWLQDTPPRRKLLLLPRDHLKTSIVGRSLGPHILLQPRDNNLYFPGCQDKNCRYTRKPLGLECVNPAHRLDGSDVRILLGYEVATNAQRQMGWVQTQWDTNDLLRALWPHKVWENAQIRKQQRIPWNSGEMTLPRSQDFPEPSIDTIGVGGAVTGRHYACHIFDDLCTLEAANSVTVMESTIEWFIASRALMDDPEYSLEFTIGTRWAVHDLYSYIHENDPTVQCITRAVVEDTKPIFPQVFSTEVIDQKRKQFGSLFPLLYMNSASDPELCDFDVNEVREFTNRSDGSIAFEDDERDAELSRLYDAPAVPFVHEMWTPLSKVYADAKEAGRDEFMKLKHGQVRSW